MQKSGGDEQQGAPGTLLPLPLKVTVLDESGQPVGGVSVTFRTTGGRVTPATGATDPQGVRRASLTLPDSEVVVTVTVSSPGLADLRFTAESVRSPPNAYTFPISVSGRFLVDAGGRVLILNGASPWSLEVQLDSAEVGVYLDTRVAQGVNALLFQAIEHRFADSAPENAYGRVPFTDTLPGGEPDFTTLDDRYWSYVEWIVSEARARGVVCLIAPSYLGARLGEEGWASEMSANGTGRLTAYGDSLGRRFGIYGNVIWVMGGDSDPSYGGADLTAEVSAVASGIRASAPDAIFTAHARRNDSALDAYDQPWLDINTTYSEPADGARELMADYLRTGGAGGALMPTIWIEGYYENEHSMTDVELRSQIYWSLLGGAVGQFYGVYPVWPFGAAAAAGFGDSSSPPYDNWRDALHTDVAEDLAIVRRLIDTRPFRLLVPDYSDSVVTSGRSSGADYAAAASASDGSLILAYLPSRRQVTVDLSKLTADSLAAASWLDPRTGDSTFIGRFPTDRSAKFTPPSGEDWLLVLEPASD